MKIIRRPADAAVLIAASEAAAVRGAMRQARREAFTAEADPLAFKVLRGEATQAEYEAKVADIRARFPYPED
jgi:hypothetical protein